MRADSKALAHKLAECVHACNDCHDACLDEQHIMMMKGCIRLDVECAQICLTALSLVHRGAHFAKEILDLCAKACEACAAECGKHPYDHCKECAQVCTECAKACREFQAA